jgi:hypothetical protein
MQRSQVLCPIGPTPFLSVAMPSSPVGGSNWSIWRRAAVPAAYSVRDFAEAGGPMSYGQDVTDAWPDAFSRAPADLPIVQTNKFELVINAETARMLGLIVPPSLLAITDEMIE